MVALGEAFKNVALGSELTLYNMQKAEHYLNPDQIVTDMNL